MRIRLVFQRTSDGAGEIRAHIHRSELEDTLIVGDYHRSAKNAWTAFLWKTPGDRSVIARTVTGPDVAKLSTLACNGGAWWT
jgi:hypothetical protein